MLYVTLSLVVALVVQALAFLAVCRSLVRQHHRERDLLVNQLCALAGKPWQPRPADERTFRREPLDVQVPDLIETGHWPDV